MKKNHFIVLVLAIFVVMTNAVSASMIIPNSDQAKEKSQAPAKSPVIGDNWDLERVDFIHYANSSKPVKTSKTPTCYKLMGVKWLNTVNYSINPLNQNGLDPAEVAYTIGSAAETWDRETSTELFNNVYDVDFTAQYGYFDGKNAIAFGDYQTSGVIAVTSIWYSKRTKEIREFDILFNNYYLWGDGEAENTRMDLANIATHELGHAVGLSDIYDDSCSAVTMYGYSDYGDIDKRTLEQADITGLQKIYGI